MRLVGDEAQPGLVELHQDLETGIGRKISAPHLGPARHRN